MHRVIFVFRMGIGFRSYLRGNGVRSFREAISSPTMQPVFHFLRSTAAMWTEQGMEDAKAMPVWPLEGSCRYNEELQMIVVKLSDDTE